MRRWSAYQWGLLVLLFVSVVLRIVLAARGGQWWWYDEGRFRVSTDAVARFSHGHFAAGLRLVLGSFDHLGFKILGLLPAVGVAAGLPIWSAAVFFGAFSVGTIWLVWRVALVAGGDEATAFWSAALAACSASLFYYSRHLFPYDPALFCGMAAIAVGLRGAERRNAWWAGVLGGIGFLIYNGYWLFCGVAVVVAVSWHGAGRRWFGRAAVAACGLLGPVLLCVLAAQALHVDLLRSAVSFSGTINQGDFTEGWSFPFDYYWHTEGLLLIGWLVAFVWALRPARSVRRPLLFWGGAVVAIYLGLGIGSAGLHRFVEYARIVRCLTPLLCLIGGAALAALLRRTPRWATAVVGFGVVSIWVRHDAPPLRQWFPDAFYAHVRAMPWRPGERILVQNAHGVRYPEQADVPVAGEVLFARPHPVSYEPFLFEGYTPAVREQFRLMHPTMRVVRVSPAQLPPTFPRLGRPPGPIELRLWLPRATYGRRAPLVVTGCGREADILSVWRESPNHFRFALYHWGKQDTVSVVVAADETTEHVLDVSFGSLLSVAQLAGTGSRLRSTLFVALDGQVVLDRRQDTYASPPNAIDIGRCVIGGGVPTLTVYPGVIRSATPLPVAAVLQRLAGGNGTVNLPALPATPRSGCRPTPCRLRAGAARRGRLSPTSTRSASCASCAICRRTTQLREISHTGFSAGVLR